MHHIIQALLQNNEQNKREHEHIAYTFYDINTAKKTAESDKKELSKKHVIALDGGSAPLLITPIVCLLYVRVVSYSTTKPVITKQEGMILATYDTKQHVKEVTKQSHNQYITVKFFEEKKEKREEKEEHAQEDQGEELFSIELKELGDEPTLLKAANLGRKLLEWRLAKKEKQTRKESESLIIWDGAFDTHSVVEEKNLPCILAIAKSTHKEQNWMQFRKEGIWLALQKEKNMYFTKLHAQSKVIVRLDLCKCSACEQKKHEEKIEQLLENLSQLSLWSCDPVFLGYPYPLIVADQLARISNEEAQRMKTRIQMLAKKDWETISFGSQESHSILDTIKF